MLFSMHGFHQTAVKTYLMLVDKEKKQKGNRESISNATRSYHSVRPLVCWGLCCICGVWNPAEVPQFVLESFVGDSYLSASGSQMGLARIVR
jgi:hypothetical protein